MTSQDDGRLDTKRFNERVKLTAALANNLAVGVLIGGLVGPIMGGHPESFQMAAALFVASAILHFYARSMLKDLKSEQ